MSILLHSIREGDDVLNCIVHLLHAKLSERVKRGFTPKRITSNPQQPAVPRKSRKQPVFGVGNLHTQFFVPFCNNVSIALVRYNFIHVLECYGSQSSASTVQITLVFEKVTLHSKLSKHLK